LGIEPDATGYVREPLHDEQFAPIRERVLAKGVSLEPAIQTFETIDLASWLFFIKRAVEAGIAKIVKGELPAKIDGKIRYNYVFNERTTETPTEKLTAAIERQSELMAALLERLAEK